MVTASGSDAMMTPTTSVYRGPGSAAAPVLEEEHMRTLARRPTGNDGGKALLGSVQRIRAAVRGR